MKNLIFNAFIMILIVSFTVSCENETAENPNADTFLQQDASKQLVSIKNVAPGEAAKLAEILKETSARSNEELKIEQELVFFRSITRFSVNNF